MRFIKVILLSMLFCKMVFAEQLTGVPELDNYHPWHHHYWLVIFLLAIFYGIGVGCICRIIYNKINYYRISKLYYFFMAISFVGVIFFSLNSFLDKVFGG